jgi:hypothetical protein
MISVLPRMEADLRPTAIPGHQRHHGRHVAADRVARNRQTGAVDADLGPVRSHPRGGSVALLDLRRIDRIRDRSILGGHSSGARADHQIADEALMVLEIAGDPDAAVEEYGDGQRTVRLFRRHNVELDVASIFRDRILRDGDTRQINGRLRLNTGQCRADLWTGQLPEWAAVLVEIRKEGPNPGGRFGDHSPRPFKPSP